MRPRGSPRGIIFGGGQPVLGFGGFNEAAGKSPRNRQGVRPPSSEGSSFNEAAGKSPRNRLIRLVLDMFLDLLQ